MRILLVDDSEDFRDLTEAALLSAGYNDVATATSALEALEFWMSSHGPTNRRPSSTFVLLRCHVMRRWIGVEACARIRSDPRYGDIIDIVPLRCCWREEILIGIRPLARSLRMRAQASYQVRVSR